MAWMPKRACPVCRRLGCTNPAHVPKPWTGTRTRKLARPDYDTAAERKRRKAVVDAFIAEHGIRLANGDTIARCPECHKMKARFIADHVVAIAEGGPEDGELRVHCASCSGQQGAKLANERRREGHPKS